MPLFPCTFHSVTGRDVRSKFYIHLIVQFSCFFHHGHGPMANDGHPFFQQPSWNTCVYCFSFGSFVKITCSQCQHMCKKHVASGFTTCPHFKHLLKGAAWLPQMNVFSTSECALGTGALPWAIFWIIGLMGKLRPCLRRDIQFQWLCLKYVENWWWICLGNPQVFIPWSLA